MARHAGRSATGGDVTAAASPDRGDRAARRLLFLLLLLTGLLLAPGYVDNVDSRLIVRTAGRLLDTGSTGLTDLSGTAAEKRPDEYGIRGPDGAWQMKFGIGNAVLAAPFVAAGRLILGVAGLPRDRAGEAGASVASALWFAVAGVLVFGIVRRFTDRRGAVAAALAYSLATYAIVYGKSSYLETPLAAAVLLAYASALDARDRLADPRPAILLGLACCAAIWIKVASCVVLCGLVPVMFAAAPRRALRPALVAAAVVLAGGAALAWTNFARFGHPFETGYATSLKFGNPLLQGLGALSAGRRGGVLLYSPLLVLALPGTLRLWRADRGLAAGVWVAFAASMLLFATFFSPFGGDAWGPRYLLPNVALLAIPAGVALAGWLTADTLRRAAAGAVVAASAAVQVPPALVSFHEVYGLRTQAEPALLRDASPQRLAARILVEKARGSATYDLADLGLGAGSHEPGRVEQGLNLWPVRVAQDMPRRAAFAWTAWALLGAAAAATAWRLARQARRRP